ncbi:MAG: bifunctional 4-hydroxy-2-oxoglutarate aldolase/2-dehydro-3-deoxy-phosphogluconate aldolase [Rhodospirillaceae bacterium]|nr:bifunctional 4-hydroxy-2-oxoglutarate aldolase/2-dehydro-3-deoxy-phosphogluconate aldolase [Rhodospirillaceae bacterium]MCA8932218.1 bifunctional 4-hydroxy-2-oxoglutarate aldolase/2-dehydro-3-deoxy-phosphogluconate aldolase [Rhodospirillaceae bacterium]
MPTDLLGLLLRHRLVPVIALNDAGHAEPLGRALVGGGLPVAEVTFRTAAAAESIHRMASALPELVVGAGTVLTPDQVDAAVDAGARFIVSPGTSARVLARCAERGVPALPGVATSSDIMAALDHGAEIVKFFPAEAAGGLPVLKALAAPFGQVRFVPTGGITPGNLASYLAHPKVVACGGTWMVKTDVIDRGAFDEVEAAVREAVKLAAG